MTQDELDQIEQLGYLQLSPDKVRIVMEISEDAWHHSIYSKDAIHNAYFKGVYRAEAEFRKSVFDLAKRNSSQAQEMVRKFIDERSKSDI